MSIHVLYILANEPTGGVGKFVLNYALNFSDEIIVDYLIYTNERNTVFQKQIKNNRNKIYYLPPLSLKNYFDLKRKTNDFFKLHASEFDIVHLSFAGIIGLCFKRAKKYGIKYRIVHSHNTKLSDNNIKSVRNKIIFNCNKYLATHFFACSEVAGEYLFGKNQENIYYVHNAIDTNQYKFDIETRYRMKSMYSLSTNKVILCVGRLEKQKNISFAIDIFKEIVNLDSSFRLLVIGEGPLEESLRKKVEDYNICDKVIFEKFTDKINVFFCMSDLLLSPSLYEGLPLTVVEAQNNGLPCLLSDTISNEIKMTDIVDFLSLNDSIKKWAAKALEMSKIVHENHSEFIINNGYDIKSEAYKLEKYYINLLKK